MVAGGEDGERGGEGAVRVWLLSVALIALPLSSCNRDSASVPQRTSPDGETVFIINNYSQAELLISRSGKELVAVPVINSELVDWQIKPLICRGTLPKEYVKVEVEVDDVDLARKIYTMIESHNENIIDSGAADVDGCFKIGR